jgi:hypothetical protein
LSHTPISICRTAERARPCSKIRLADLLAIQQSTNDRQSRFKQSEASVIVYADGIKVGSRRPSTQTGTEPPTCQSVHRIQTLCQFGWRTEWNLEHGGPEFDACGRGSDRHQPQERIRQPDFAADCFANPDPVEAKRPRSTSRVP